MTSIIVRFRIKKLSAVLYYAMKHAVREVARDMKNSHAGRRLTSFELHYKAKSVLNETSGCPTLLGVPI